ncbi:MAG: BMP family ABC transporter substrate-binding protein [Clostridia bacterium]|nr:BMP family ABC transporter substrate-binding protein [Clostridia bacterium]
MKKLMALLLSAVMLTSLVIGFASCDLFGGPPVVGLICLHGESSTYDKNFIDAFEAACKAKGLSKSQYRIVVDVPESNKCYEEAANLADMGCKAIFADSFGHEQHMIKAANEFKDVHFFHATGTQAKVKKLNNYHNAFASIYEGRYLAGYAAGLTLNTMKNKAVNNVFKVGYVGAWTYAEVMSGYTSWFLGLKAALDNGYSATMEVQFTGSWYDEQGEKTAAENLITRGAVLVSQHADSMGAPTACDNKGVPNVSYNGSTGKNTLVAYSKINWEPYFKKMIDNALNGTEVPTDYCGSFTDDSVQYEIGPKAPSGAAATLERIENELKAGTRKVFDTSKFTVNGNRVTSYEADINGDYEPDTGINVIKTANGVSYFDESNASEFRSAPYFDLEIDGITLLNRVYESDENGNPIIIT